MELRTSLTTRPPVIYSLKTSQFGITPACSGASLNAEAERAARVRAARRPNGATRSRFSLYAMPSKSTRSMKPITAISMGDCIRPRLLMAA